MRSHFFHKPTFPHPHIAPIWANHLIYKQASLSAGRCTFFFLTVKCEKEELECKQGSSAKQTVLGWERDGVIHLLARCDEKSRDDDNEIPKKTHASPSIDQFQPNDILAYFITVLRWLSRSFHHYSSHYYLSSQVRLGIRRKLRSTVFRSERCKL